MTVSLMTMTQNDFTEYMSHSIKHYADEKIKAGTWTQEEALEKASESFQKLLPQGLASQHHYLYVIVNDENKDKMGWLWYRFNDTDPQSEAFIYDFYIYGEARGKGFGKAALKALDAHARQIGIKKLSLHVFAHNERAIHLYEKLDYKPTGIRMSKWL